MFPRPPCPRVPASALALALCCLLALPAAAQAGVPRTRSGSAGAAPAATAPLPDRPNILLIVLDDVGVDLLDAYAESTAVRPCTPTIVALAASGVLFRNAWGSPTWSPTRAQILTGRHGFRTGNGVGINGFPQNVAGLPRAEVTLAEALLPQGYSTGVFGKWHLARGNFNPAEPLAQGFQWFEGSIDGTLLKGEGTCPSCPPGCSSTTLNYYRWVRSVNGVEVCDGRYATTANVDDALSVTGTVLPEPWFLTMAFNAAHSPFHNPPQALCPGAGCVCAGPLATDAERAKASLEVADVEIGRLIATLHARSALPLMVFLIGDNGTAQPVAEATPGGCFDPARSKGTMYEGGINVPLIVSGPGVVPGEVGALVCATDLFSTVAQLARSPLRPADSVSLVPYLRGFRGELRACVFAEQFVPNGLPYAPTGFERAMRNARYKLIRRSNRPDELYDLLLDPCEKASLFPPAPGTPAAAAWQYLDAQLRAMHES